MKKYDVVVDAEVEIEKEDLKTLVDCAFCVAVDLCLANRFDSCEDARSTYVAMKNKKDEE